MQGLIIVATLVAIVVSVIVITSRPNPIVTPNRSTPAIKRQPMNIRMMKRRYLKRTQRLQEYYHHEHLKLFMLLLYHSYRREQAVIGHH